MYITELGNGNVSG